VEPLCGSPGGELGPCKHNSGLPHELPQVEGARTKRSPKLVHVGHATWRSAALQGRAELVLHSRRRLQRRWSFYVRHILNCTRLAAIANVYFSLHGCATGAGSQAGGHGVAALRLERQSTR